MHRIFAGILALLLLLAPVLRVAGGSGPTCQDTAGALASLADGLAADSGCCATPPKTGASLNRTCSNDHQCCAPDGTPVKRLVAVADARTGLTAELKTRAEFDYQKFLVPGQREERLAPRVSPLSPSHAAQCSLIQRWLI